MRKVAAGIMALCFAGLQGVSAEAIITAQDYAVESDVVLESAVREIKSIPQDTVNLVGDAVKFVTDDLRATVKTVETALKTPPNEKLEKPAMIEVANAWNSCGDILFRSYTISEAVGNELTRGKDGNVIDVSDSFPGMDFSKGSSVYYRPEFKKLFVRQTLENVLTIEDFLAEHHSATRELMGKQVEIETKFIEINQSTLNELGFSWYFGGKNPAFDSNGNPVPGTGGAHIFENLILSGGQRILSDSLRTGSSALGGSPAGVLDIAKTSGSLWWSGTIRALEQSDNADVLSAPKIVTRDGSTATIQVGDERMLPKRFGVNSANSSIYVENSGWEAMLMGVQLEVTPELRAENLIDLDLKPKILDILGYDNYQVSPDNASMWPIQGQPLVNSLMVGRYPVVTYTKDKLNSVGELFTSIMSHVWENDSINSNRNTDVNDYLTHGNYNVPPGSAQYGYQDQRRNWDRSELIQVPALHGQLPYFRIREMSTQVTVEDGSTVGMGGLIYDKLETFKDKVPVLGSIPWVGRLFRSEGERSIKRNLMIFVTATQVDVNGRRAVDLATK
ncbi:MAG: hypothetical protein WC959_01725 [Kiritimatiellales bacterium]